ncbi:MAG: CoA-binding protein [Candidatus Helarchaeota archaeon]|nr:CoA-binding protein [Candidatus Helarchaeota archaeon]
MDFFFTPSSVAVIGASRNEKRPGHNVLKNLIDLKYKGKIYPINPNVDTLLDLQVYPSIKDVPEPVDLAVIITPTPLVPQMLRDCADQGVKGAVIITEGFAETGEAESIELQDELKKVCKETGIRVVGPGSMGIVNLQNNFTSSYVNFQGLNTTGNITFIAQSGIFTGGLVRYFATYDLPVSRIISLGNKIDVDDADVLNYIAKDPQTKVIAIYVEGINDGKQFIEAAKSITRKKPVVLLKGGTTPAGALAASSHTSSIAVNSDIFDAVAKQTGLVKVNTLSELFETARAFSLTPILPQGPRIAIITYSGCLGVLSSDTALKLGLQMATFTKETSEKIQEVVFDRRFGANPIDTYPATLKSGNENTFKTCLDLVLQDPNVDGCLLTVWGDETPEERTFSPNMRDIILHYQKQGKFTIVPVLGEKLGVERERKFFEDNGIVTTIFADHAIKLYNNLYRYAQFLKSNK